MLLGSLCATRVESWGAGGKGGSGTGWNMPVADHCITGVGFVQFNLHFLRDFPSLWSVFQSKAGQGALLWEPVVLGMTGHGDNVAHECDTALDTQTITLECKSLTHSLCSIWSLFLLPHTLPHLNILMIFLFSLPRFYLCQALLLARALGWPEKGRKPEPGWDQQLSLTFACRANTSLACLQNPSTETVDIHLRPNNWDGFLNYLGHQEWMSVWKNLRESL